MSHGPALSLSFPFVTIISLGYFSTDAASIIERSRGIGPVAGSQTAGRTELNNRPQAILQDRTPVEVFAQLLTSATVPMLQ